MTTAYHVQTARTAKLPPVWSDYAFQQNAPLVPYREANLYSTAQDLTWAAASNAAPNELLLAIKIPDSYPQLPPTLDYLSRPEQAFVKTPHHGRLGSKELITRIYETAFCSKLALRSAATEPSSNTVTTLLSPKENSTAALPASVIILAIADAFVANEADNWLSKARAAARAGDLRSAYRNVYRGLDVLMKRAKWNEVSSVLEELSSITYPTAFGIGAMRFASSAAQQVPNWNAILNKLIETARRQKVDIQKSFRGLIETNGAK
jgi:hypothetical protein